jgi:hypothetical protein
MNDAQCSCGGEAAIERFSQALHDLCQPLTTLQCRLELAELTRTPEAYRQAVVLGLAECARLMQSVAVMQTIMRDARAAETMGARP